MRANEWPGCDLFGTSGNRSSGKGGRGAAAVHEGEGRRRWAQAGVLLYDTVVAGASSKDRKSVV